MIKNKLVISLLFLVLANSIFARTIRKERSLLYPYPPPVDDTALGLTTILDKTDTYSPSVEFAVNTLEAKHELNENEEVKLNPEAFPVQPYPSVVLMKTDQPVVVPLLKPYVQETSKPYAPVVPIEIVPVEPVVNAVETREVIKPYPVAVPVTTIVSKSYPPAITILEEKPTAPVVPVVDYHYTLGTAPVVSQNKPYFSAVPISAIAKDEIAKPYPPAIKEPTASVVPVSFEYHYSLENPQTTEAPTAPKNKPYPPAAPVTVKEKIAKPYAPAVPVKTEEPTAPVVPVAFEYHYTLENPQTKAPLIAEDKPYPPAAPVTATIVKEEIAKPYAPAVPVKEEEPTAPVVPVSFEYHYTLENPQTTEAPLIAEDKPYPPAIPVIKEEPKVPVPVIVSEYHYTLENTKPYEPQVTENNVHSITVPVTTTSKPYPPAIFIEEISKPAAIPLIKEPPTAPVVSEYHYTADTSAVPETKPYASDIPTTTTPQPTTVAYPYPPHLPVDIAKFENSKPYPAALPINFLKF